jgi:Na+/proline symporter
MLAAVVIIIVLIGQELSFDGISAYFEAVSSDPRSKIFNWDWKDGTNFFKQFISGAFITIVMTGLDQDMMQKNLTCKNIGDAQKNMFWFTIILVIVNILFLSLGIMLYLYAETKGISLPTKSDELFPLLATQHFSAFAGIIFVLGIVAAAYSSADSTLTALTTSFCIDFLEIDRRYPADQRVKVRQRVHVAFSLVMILAILMFYWINDQSVINSVFIIAGYTYGPLLGLYAFGLFTKWQVKDRWVPLLAVSAPVLTFLVSQNSERFLWGYKFGFEALILNGLLMFLGLVLIRKK